MNQVVKVNFRGNDLYGFQSGALVFVALKPIVVAMGLNWSGQEQRVKRDPILKEGICVMHMPSEKGLQDAICLRLDLLNGWLFKIDSTRLKEELREKVQVFQRECYRVLHTYFSGELDHNRDKLVREANEATSLNLRLVTESRHTHGLRAAAQLWDALGLPKVPAMADRLGQGSLFDYLPASRAA